MSTKKNLNRANKNLKSLLISLDERNQFLDTPAYKFGFEQGIEQGSFQATEEHKEVIYNLVMSVYGKHQ
jgi:hypothetical protein